MSSTHRVCSRCVMDTTVPKITFDDQGVCNYCEMHDLLIRKYPLGEAGQTKVRSMVEEIKRRGKHKQYDCIVGVSGGVDSTYCLYLAKQWGLRILAVHVDNGWNSEVSVRNLERVLKKFDIELYTYVIDWEEFKDLQVAFLKASVPDMEIPTDIAIYSVLFKTAAKLDIPSIINGHSIRAEGTQPLEWTYMDGKYIESVYREYGKTKTLKRFPNFKIHNLLYYSFIKRIKEYRPLEFIEYSKAQASQILARELQWEDYGGHHYESIYTRFVHSYILLEKFNYDKRKVTLSAQIRSGVRTRDEALKILKAKPYPEEKTKEDMEYVIKKIGLSRQEFNEIMNSPLRTFNDYSTYLTVIRKLRYFIKIACKLKFMPEVFYEKYAKS